MEYSLKTDSGCTTLTFFGRFDMKARQTFLDAFQLAREENAKKIVFDLREVPFLDSVAIGLIVIAHKRYQNASGALTLRVCEGPVKQALDLMRISDLIPVVTDE
ncbi:MAG: STAS domain-containing protein [Nitrospirales bacterium]